MPIFNSALHPQCVEWLRINTKLLWEHHCYTGYNKCGDKIKWNYLMIRDTMIEDAQINVEGPAFPSVISFNIIVTYCPIFQSAVFILFASNVNVKWQDQTYKDDSNMGYATINCYKDFGTKIWKP